MAVTRKKLGEKILETLARGTLDGLVFKLPPGLDRGLYVECNNALNRCGGVWDRRKGGHVFPPGSDPTAAIAAVLGTGSAPPKNPLAYWPTPDRVADEMVEVLTRRPAPNPKLLEPSAGDGALLRAFRRSFVGHGPADPTVYIAVEVDHAHLVPLGETLDRCDSLVSTGTDFLKTTTAGLAGPFGRVLMNPPFAAEGDPDVYVKHVRHAYGMLAPGGRLVSVAPAGFTFNARLRDFLDFVEANGSWTELAEGAFRESGTDTKCVLVVLDKPA